mgnify:CR=1 FL=1
MAVKKAVAADALNVVSNNEEAAGQKVFHAHTHVVPRHENDGVYKMAKHISYKEGEAKEISQKIISAL